MAVEYIHYGHKKFQINRFVPIRNEKLRNKPFGGLWASRTDAKYGWKEWNEDEQFRECEEENSFKFTLSTNANVLEIHSHKDLSKVPQVKKSIFNGSFLDKFVQANNKRNNHFIKINGEIGTVANMARKFNVSYWNLLHYSNGGENCKYQDLRIEVADESEIQEYRKSQSYRAKE